MPRIKPLFPPPLTEWTKIPNSHLDRLLPILSNPELRLLLVIQRKAYGYHYIELPLNVSCEELMEWTGLKRSSVVSGLRSLKKKDLIFTFKGFPHPPKTTAQKSSDLRSRTRSVYKQERKVKENAREGYPQHPTSTRLAKQLPEDPEVPKP